jgi:hypothetical protein
MTVDNFVLTKDKVQRTPLRKCQGVRVTDPKTSPHFLSILQFLQQGQRRTPPSIAYYKSSRPTSDNHRGASECRAVVADLGQGAAERFRVLRPGHNDVARESKHLFDSTDRFHYSIQYVAISRSASKSSSAGRKTFLRLQQHHQRGQSLRSLPSSRFSPLPRMKPAYAYKEM